MIAELPGTVSVFFHFIPVGGSRYSEERTTQFSCSSLISLSLELLGALEYIAICVLRYAMPILKVAYTTASNSVPIEG